MIDIEKAKLEFDNYTKKYDMEDEAINRKYYHTYRVMDISGEIAKSLNLSEKDVELAELIGLLHDIARFEQYKKFQTFSDLKSIDHGDFGVEILKKDSLIRKFVETNQYDNIVLKAVKNHNKFEIEDGLNEKELLFSKIVRDADKLDIYFEGITMFYKTSEEIATVENGIITDDYMEKILKNEKIERKINQNKIDSFILLLCFVFDYNFKYSFETMDKEDYINKLIDRFDFKNPDTKEKMGKIREILNNYIQSKKG